MTQAILCLTRSLLATKRAVLSKTVVSLAMLVFALLHTDAGAQVTDFRLERVDNSAGGPALDGYVTNDLVIDFMGLYTGSQILLELERGTVYQDPLGSHLPPSRALIDLSPSVAFDTFFTSGSEVLSGVSENVRVFGGAVNLGGEPPISIEANRINVAWGPPGGAGLRDRTGFLTARITLSEDAIGTWRLLGSADQVITIIGPPGLPGGEAIRFADSGQIRSGAIMFSEQIPEPATLSLISVIAAAALAFPRSRNLLWGTVP